MLKTERGRGTGRFSFRRGSCQLSLKRVSISDTVGNRISIDHGLKNMFLYRIAAYVRVDAANGLDQQKNTCESA